MAAMGRGETFALCGHEILKKSSLKPSFDFDALKGTTWPTWGKGETFCTIQTRRNSSKNLLFRNRWSDFEIISQESGFEGHPIAHLGHNCNRQAAFTIFESARESKIFGPF